MSRHDRLTRGHSERVRAYADLIGQQLRLDDESTVKLHWAALVHDVGKLDVPAEILTKKGRPTQQEWMLVLQQHPGASRRYLRGLDEWLGEWGRAATEHHERIDGDGYPLGLRGDEISLAGRIVAVADAFDVMTSARSYKKPHPAARARAELAENAGTQFDPDIVRAFLSVSLREVRLVMGPLAFSVAAPTLAQVPLETVTCVRTVHHALAAAGRSRLQRTRRSTISRSRAAPTPSRLNADLHDQAPRRTEQGRPCRPSRNPAAPTVNPASFRPAPRAATPTGDRPTSRPRRHQALRPAPRR